MTDRMSDVEIKHYLNLATEELVAAQGNLRLGHLRGRQFRVPIMRCSMPRPPSWVARACVWRSKHQGLIAAFGEYFVKSGLVERPYGRMLHDAFEARLDSDYAPYPL